MYFSHISIISKQLFSRDSGKTQSFWMGKHGFWCPLCMSNLNGNEKYKHTISYFAIYYLWLPNKTSIHWAACYWNVMVLRGRVRERTTVFMHSLWVCRKGLASSPCKSLNNSSFSLELFFLWSYISTQCPQLQQLKTQENSHNLHNKWVSR